MEFRELRSLRIFALAPLATALVLLTACSTPAPGLDAAALAPAFVGPDVIALPDGFQPEGIVAGRGPELFAGSLADGSVVRVDPRTGAVDVAVPPQVGRIAVGLDYDVRTDRLWVAGGHFGAGYAYDASTGTTAEVFSFGGAFVNDVIVTQDAAWFTDSFAPVLYRVPLEPTGEPAGGFTVVPLSGDFTQGPTFSANGIEATADGAMLFVAHSDFGAIFAVDPDTGAATTVDLGGDDVASGDGLLLDGRMLYVVQNFFNQIAVVRLAPDGLSGEVITQITTPEFDVPTTVAGFGASLYAVNARFGTPPTPTTSYDVVRVDKVRTDD